MATVASVLCASTTTISSAQATERSASSMSAASLWVMTVTESFGTLTEALAGRCWGLRWTVLWLTAEGAGGLRWTVPGLTRDGAGRLRWTVPGLTRDGAGRLRWTVPGLTRDGAGRL